MEMVKIHFQNNIVQKPTQKYKNTPKMKKKKTHGKVNRDPWITYYIDSP